MTKKQMLDKFRQIVEGEIKHCELCIKRNEEKKESLIFWQGAWRQSLEILDVLERELRI